MRFSELDRATVGVWGAGREIRSFAAQLAARIPSARIAVIASDEVLDGDVLDALKAPHARLVTGAGTVAALAGCDIVVRSPGVSVHRPELRELRAGGVAVTTATALWLAETRGAGVIGVTGTKGKSTTAALIHHIARAAGATSHLVGNIGVPALDLLDLEPANLSVIELSSYQIADLQQGPEIAVVTNLHREHLDWHGSDEAYRADKLRLLGLPGVRAKVVNGRDPNLVASARGGVAPTVFGSPDGWDVAESGVMLDGRLVVPAAQLPLLGEHNALNLCAALAALTAFGIALPALPEALRGFHPLPHRLAVVGERAGVLWVDDSISTTPESTLAALESFPHRKIVLVGGGQDRGQDYTELGRILAERGAAVLGLPETGSRLVGAAREAGLSDADALHAGDMETAVTLARRLAQPGGIVLLSPAAPSFNMYRNFEERAAHFRALAHAEPEGG